MLPSTSSLAGVHRRGLGYLRCPAPLKPTGDFGQHLLGRGVRVAAASNGSSVTLAPSRAPIEDQGNTDSCPGHGTSQVSYTAAKAAGVPLPFVPSPAGIYTTTRDIQRVALTPAGTALPALADQGAMPPYIAKAVALFGLRAIQAPTPDGRYSDVDPDNVNLEAAVLDLEAAGLCLVAGMYEIAIDGNLETLIQSANAAKIPVAAGMFVDSDFMNWTPNMPPVASVNFSDPNGGGHWMSEDTFSVTSSGQGVYTLVSSWGTSFGDQGTVRVTGNCLRQAGLDYWPWAISPSANTGRPIPASWARKLRGAHAAYAPPART